MSTQTVDSTLGFRMPAEARLAGLTLRVRDLDSVAGFYTTLLGLRIAERHDGGVRLAPAQALFSLDLVWDPNAPVRPRPSLGLYHFALLLPDRPSLAAVLRRLLEGRWALEGASDHGVSEALYLHDPEGNGIELYRDRPREAWPVAESQVAMTTAPLDVDRLLEAAPAASVLHPETRFGHIHLHVADLGDGERFYAHSLGLAVTQRSYPGALFLAAGGYHHHVGLNTWARGRRAPDGATGLVEYAWEIPIGTVERLAAHLRAEHASYVVTDRKVGLTDPIGIRVDLGEPSA
jgi:catechol 2,3-dioxygenase